MSRKALSLLVGLAMAAGFALGAGRAAAELHPSSDVLLPYFEVDVNGFGRNTLFAVCNSADKPVNLTIGIYTNWGIPVLEVPISLLADQVQSVSLRDWIALGRLPGRTLDQAEIDHLKAALSGRPSPKDGLYYGTEVTPDRAIGYVLVRSLGAPRPDALWGDFFVTDPTAQYLYGDTLVNLDPTVETMGTCERHLIRFLEGGAFAAGTELFVWTGKTGQPSATPIYTGTMTSTTTLGYDEAGHELGTFREDVLSTQLMPIGDMSFRPFGWLDLRTPDPSFVGARFASGLASAAFHSYCAPLEENAPTGPAIALGKLVNGLHADSPPGLVLPVGTAITWEYIVQNTGNARLEQVKVTDSPAVSITCPKDVLEPGETMSCTASGVAVGCLYMNLATATGVAPTGESVIAQDFVYYFGATGAALALVTRVEGQDANTPPGPNLPLGATVHLTYEVTNIGKAPLTEVAVSDDTGMAVHCPATTLAVGETMVCTGTEPATGGAHVHQGRAQATPPCGAALVAKDVAYYNVPAPSIRLKKLVNGEDADLPPGPPFQVGGSLLWTYLVTNTGDVPLTQIAVVDDRGVAVTCPKSVLQPAESMTCTGSGTVQAGAYKNVGTATGQPPQGPAVTASDPCHYTGYAAGLTLKKSVNGEDANTPPGPMVPEGSALSWTYLVTNTGTIALAQVAVVDDHGVEINCPKTTLQPAESMTCTGKGVAVAGQYANLGTAAGLPPNGVPVTATDPCHYYGFQARIGLQKLTNGQDAPQPPGPSIPIGNPVLWTYVATNLGDVELTQVTVTDDRGVDVACPKDVLAVAETMTCTGHGTAKAGLYENVGTATGTPLSGPVVHATYPSHYQGAGGDTGDQGCTPGYWKNHADSWPPTGYAPSQTVSSVFPQVVQYPELSSATLLDALGFQGGPDVSGAAEILLRAGVAALLNAAHPGVDFPRTSADVILAVETALSGGNRDAMLVLAAALDADNNLGCPLN
jgi:hypothetical protein